MSKKAKNSHTEAASSTSASRNVSGEKRAELNRKIAEIESFIQRAQQDENTKNLLTYIADLKKDLRTKKYGLVFEEHREQIDDILDNNTPVLTEDKGLLINNGGQINFLIEGDNLASLQLLEKTHKGKIDLIYIDPPYNTGKEFVYNDNIVEETDTFRHSKWLSFMSKRLIVAKELLKPNGVIFVSIDDHEAVNLEMLCDEIFNENNKIAVLPRVIKRGGKSTDKVAKNHDYIVIYAKNESTSEFNPFVIEDDASKVLTDEYYSERGAYRLNQCLDYDSLQYNESMDYEINIEGETFYAGGSKELWERRHAGEHGRIDWVWRWSKQLFEWGYKNGFVVVKKGKRRRIYTKTYANCEIVKDDNGNYRVEKCENTKAYDSLFFVDNRFSNDNAKKELAKIGLPKKFEYPKPTELVREFLKMVKTPESPTILDFFAGSGTTGHAVMRLNKEDGGKRKFILCTNNENNICREVTYERIRRVIEREGYKASLKYFRVEFVPLTERLYDEYAHELLAHIRELVELENAINFTGNARIAIILTEEELDVFAASLDENSECETIYLGQNILVRLDQRKLFNRLNIKINVIPNYYYKELSMS